MWNILNFCTADSDISLKDRRLMYCFLKLRQWLSEKDRMLKYATFKVLLFGIHGEEADCLNPHSDTFSGVWGKWRIIQWLWRWSSVRQVATWCSTLVVFTKTYDLPWQNRTKFYNSLSNFQPQKHTPVQCSFFHLIVRKHGLQERYFPCRAFCIDLVAMTVCRLGNVSTIQCNSGCLVLQSAAVYRAVTISVNVAGMQWVFNIDEQNHNEYTWT